MLRNFSRLLQPLRKPSPKVALFSEEPLDLPVAENGGFFAATLNSTLNSRYTLIGKLGWGIHSSVWLAQDTSKTSLPSYAAIKILSTHATEVQGRLANELDILQRINTHINTHPGHKHITVLRDNFTLTDHYGPHLCLVTEVLGSPVPRGKLPVPLVKSITRQLLLALDFLHRECGIVHTDIKRDNILFLLPNVNQAVQHYLDDKASASSLTNLSETSPPVVLSRPIVSYKLDELRNSPHIQSNCEVQLTDFGTAATVDGFHADTIQPYALRAPEVILGNGWGTSADIWNLGCLIFEFLTGKWLFQPRSGPRWSLENYHLAHMPFIAGEGYEISFFQKGAHFDKYFTSDGYLRIPFTGCPMLEEALDNYQVLDDADRPLCLDFLQSMLRLKPSDRASAAELLEHPWIQLYSRLNDSNFSAHRNGSTDG